MIYNRLIGKEAKLAVIGLGYVGLPLALEFAGKMSVIGFDVDEARLAKLRSGIDPSCELGKEAFAGADIEFTASVAKLQEASFFIIAVPTPVDKHNCPDISNLLGAFRSVAKCIGPGDYVVLESTVYPGCTEDECVPVLERYSGLKAGADFKFGYSPERINPGDRQHTLRDVVKIVSGCDSDALEQISMVYGEIVKEGIYRAPSIKVAEAAKIIENIQRDVNVALMNELSIIFSRMGINTYDVLEAAGTKWNFLKFSPGLVGGHCIGVDPYYMVYKANELKYHSRLISAGRFINDSMGGYVAKKLVKKLIGLGKSIGSTRILVLGVTFKENISDIRNSKVFDIVNELRDYGAAVEISDPYAVPEDVRATYGMELIEEPGNGYDAIIVSVAHDEYKSLDEDFFLGHTRADAVLVDIKGIYRGKMHGLEYWSL